MVIRNYYTKLKFQKGLAYLGVTYIKLSFIILGLSRDRTIIGKGVVVVVEMEYGIGLGLGLGLGIGNGLGLKL